MNKILMQFNESLFFRLHNLIYDYPSVRMAAYIVAEYMDIVIIGIGFLFIVLPSISQYQKTFSLSALREVFSVAVTLGIAWGISWILKLVVAYPRPFITFQNIQPVFVYGGFDSFPSGHATLFAALGMIFFLYHKKPGLFFLFWACAIGISRIIVGIHYPVDVLFGWILGVLVAYSVYRLSSCKD